MNTDRELPRVQKFCDMTCVQRAALGVMLLLSLAALGLASVSIWHQLRQPVIVTVDLIGLADDARTRLHDKEKMALFAQNLQRELARISHDEHLVILPGRVVASGAPDITARLRRRLLP